MLINFETLNEVRVPLEGHWKKLANWGVTRLYPEMKLPGDSTLLPTNAAIVAEIDAFLAGSRR